MSAKDTVTMMNDIGEKNAERLNALGELNLRTWEKLAARQMEAMNLLAEQSVRQMKLATESKGYSEFLKGQVELAKELSARMMEESKANMKIANEIRDEYRAWGQQGMSELSAEMRKNAPSA